MDCSNSQVIGFADSLTDATWNLSVQEEELRGGPGNPLLASTFHDQTLEISFTDALISTDLIGAMIGATGTSTGRTDTQGVFMFTEEVTYSSGGSLSMTKNASQFAPKHSTSTASALKYTGWYRKEGETEWSIGIITNGVSPATGTMAPSGSASLTAGKYCVKYMIDTAQSGDTTFNLNAD